jgi:D-aspartate ligase
MKYKTPAIVLGMAVTGLAVVRALARQGVKVYALDPDRDKPTLVTRFADCRVCPDAHKRPAEFKKFLLDMVKEVGEGAVLLPTNDNFNDFVNNHRDELLKHFKFVMTDKTIMDQLMDKKGQSDLANNVHVPMPKTFYPQNSDEMKSIANEVRYPVILKGLTTSLWRQKYGDTKGMIAANKETLLKEFEQIHQAKIDCVVQEIIEGDDQCHY